VSALFVSCFAFDTLGDSHGWRAGLGAAGALTGAALAVMLGYSRYCYYYHGEGEGWAAVAALLRRVGFCGSLGDRERDAKGGGREVTRESHIELRESLLSSTNNPLVDARWSAGRKSCAGSTD
jgi:hypothetical protein